MKVCTSPGNEMNTTDQTPCINGETVDDFVRSIRSRNFMNVRFNFNISYKSTNSHIS